MSYRRRTYPEVLDNVLTSITGGIAAESHPFPPPAAVVPPFVHNLVRPPVADIVSVYGRRNGDPYLFRKEKDYLLLDDAQTVQWLEGGDLPDAGSLVHINYYPESAKPVLTDIQTGSVVRTLAESVSLELAQLYAQLEVVYQSGYVDTASGSSLDNVVALLGVERITGGRAVGELEFERVPGSRGVITIPAGTRIITPDGNVEYETIEEVRMAPGQSIIRVQARDIEENEPLPADALTVLPIPIVGISGVTNPAPTVISNDDETDTLLRTRAKNFLHGSERATLGALKAAILRQGITAEVTEVAPGLVEVTPLIDDISPDLQQRLLAAIEAARPAGIRVTLKGALAPERVNLELQLVTDSTLLEQDLRGVQDVIRTKIEQYIRNLKKEEAGSINRVVGLVLESPEVQDVRILSATLPRTGRDILNLGSGELEIQGMPKVLGDIQIIDPNLPTRLTVLVTHPSTVQAPDAGAIQTAISETILYLNEANATDSIEPQRQSLAFEKMLYVLPILPEAEADKLKDFDDAVIRGDAVPALPNETDIAPYRVQIIITQESGLSVILANSGVDPYVLSRSERLSLNSVEVQEEGDA